MPPETKNDALWYVLDKIQKDIDKIDEKWDTHILSTAKLSHELQTVSGKVSELNKLLTVDNGKPSIITQLRDVSNDINSVKTAVTAIQQDLEAVKVHVGIKDPTEVRMEKLKNIGKTIGVVGLTLPGILTFIAGWLGN